MGMSCGGFPAKISRASRPMILPCSSRADHESADNAVAQIRVAYAKDRSIRGASDHGKSLGDVQKLPPLRVLEEGEIKNYGVVRKMPHPFQQLAHRQVGQVGDIELVLIRNELRLYQRGQTSVIIGLPRDHEEVAGFR